MCLFTKIVSPVYPKWKEVISFKVVMGIFDTVYFTQMKKKSVFGLFGFSSARAYYYIYDIIFTQNIFSNIKITFAKKYS